MNKRTLTKLCLIVTTYFFCLTASALTFSDPLPSWNDGKIKNNIINFVNSVTDKSSNDYVAPEDRIATIDNDGTLWVEQPIYTQVIFALDRIKELAPKHPEWKKQPFFQLIAKHQFDKLTAKDLATIMMYTHTGMSVEQYHDIASKWLAVAKNPRFKHRYTELVYQPMLEVMDYLRQNGFTIYIVSGGGQDFMRAFTQKTYHVPPNQVIGTAGKTKYSYQDKQPQLTKLPSVLFIDDKTGKPESIDLFIGKKPIIAFGNSIGDKEMLEWTQSNKAAHLMLLVHHDDAKREYAYDTQSKVGTFTTSLMQEAEKNSWNVISMKNDWKVIFPFTE